MGYSVLALDRPGYGASLGRFPRGQTLTAQAATVRAAIAAFTARHVPRAGILLLGDSFGAKVRLRSWHRPRRAGVAGRGRLGVRAQARGESRIGRPRGGAGPAAVELGLLSLYPVETFQVSRTVVAPMPEHEVDAAESWMRLSAAILPRVRVPVRLTFAEHEAWWRDDDDAIADLTARLSAAPRIVVDRLPDAGHNISLGWTAGAYHLKALAFVEECAAHERGTAPGDCVGARRRRWVSRKPSLTRPGLLTARIWNSLSPCSLTSAWITFDQRLGAFDGLFCPRRSGSRGAGLLSRAAVPAPAGTVSVLWRGWRGGSDVPEPAPDSGRCQRSRTGRFLPGLALVGCQGQGEA